MNIEPAGDGWLIAYAGRFYHVDQKWLDDMFRHQVKPYGNNPDFNLLQHAFNTGEPAPVIADRFKTFMDRRGIHKTARRAHPRTELEQFVRRQRDKNRRQTLP